MASIEKRKTSKGEIRYRAVIRKKGYPPQRQTFSRRTDATRWIKQTEAEIEQGIHLKTIESKKHTLNELVERYIEFYIADNRKDRKRIPQLKWWQSQLGDYLLSEITAPRLSEMKQVLGKDKAPATVNRYLAALSHVFTMAVNEWEWMDDNPMRKVKRPKEPRGRVRYLDEEEKNKLLEVCKNHPVKELYPIVVLAISTGMRQGEILNLTWQDVDLIKGRCILHDTKNGERRAVPIVGLAKETLSKWSKIRKLNSDLVFSGKNPRTPIFIRTPWMEAIKEAEIDDFRFHDLRHTAASYLAMSGASLAEIAEILGHKTLSMVRRYAHLSEGHTSKVAERMAEKFL